MLKDKDSVDANGGGGYKKTLRALQIELVKVQKHIIKHGHVCADLKPALALDRGAGGR